MWVCVCVFVFQPFLRRKYTRYRNQTRKCHYISFTIIITTFSHKNTKSLSFTVRMLVFICKDIKRQTSLVLYWQNTSFICVRSWVQCLTTPHSHPLISTVGHSSGGSSRIGTSLQIAFKAVVRIKAKWYYTHQSGESPLLG